VLTGKRMKSRQRGKEAERRSANAGNGCRIGPGLGRIGKSSGTAMGPLLAEKLSVCRGQGGWVDTTGGVHRGTFWEGPAKRKKKKKQKKKKAVSYRTGGPFEQNKAMPHGGLNKT